MKIRHLFKKELECFKSIDELPVYNWYKINMTNDLSWLLKTKREVSEKEKEKLYAIWDFIFCEYIDEFGMPETMLEIILLRRDIALLEMKIYLTKDRSYNTTLNIKKHELTQLLKHDVKDNFGKTKAFLDKQMNQRIDERKVSVKEFYNYVRIIEEEIRSRKKAS